jgi:hypothetical protein
MRARRVATLLGLVIPALACPLLAQNAGEPTPKEAAPVKYAVPDGTPVKLRFAQALWGYQSGFRMRPYHVNAGDKARLVVAEDVSVGGKVIIRKGAPAQATVDNLWLPTRDKNGAEYPCTCISFVFDWVQTIDKEKISLRADAKGRLSKKGDVESKSFTFDVHSTRTGNVARTVHLGPGLWEAMTFQSLAKMIHQKTWIPPGTRLDSFVNGNFSLDAAAVDDAQTQLPAANENALVMIYRTKGQKEIQPRISCDAKEVGPLGMREFVSLELPPGEHSCGVNTEDPFAFTAEGGKEYYLYLQYATLSGKWKLSLVDRLEGEDGVEQAYPATKPAPTQAPDKPTPAS